MTTEMLLCLELYVLFAFHQIGDIFHLNRIYRYKARTAVSDQLNSIC